MKPIVGSRMKTIEEMKYNAIFWNDKVKRNILNF